MLLDEPFAGLTTGEAVQRIELITDRRENANAGVVIVEHDVPLLLESCNSLTVLDAGAVVANGIPNEVMADQAVREAYMGEVVGEPMRTRIHEERLRRGRMLSVENLEVRYGPVTACAARPSRSARARWSSSWAPTAPASPRC